MQYDQETARGGGKRSVCANERKVRNSQRDGGVNSEEDDAASYSSDDTVQDILSDQTWCLSCMSSNQNEELHSVFPSSVGAGEERPLANSLHDPALLRFASSCSPEYLGSRYAIDQVVSALVRWHCDEKGTHSVQDSRTETSRYSCKVEEMLFRRNVSVHCTVTRMDMAAKRQVLSAMRQQPHTQDAIIPWLGASVSQVCSYQLMSKGLPAYAPGEPASEQAQEIVQSFQK